MRLIKFIESVDKYTDYIPVISTIKNAVILLYKTVHKVDTAVTPIFPEQVSRAADLKIHLLSKDKFLTKMGLIPVFGNLFLLIHNIAEARRKQAAPKEPFVIQGDKPDSPMDACIGIRRILYVWSDSIKNGPLKSGYLNSAAANNQLNKKNHSLEVVRLYLARNPDRPTERLGRALRKAIRFNHVDVFKVIFDHIAERDKPKKKKELTPEFLRAVFIDTLPKEKIIKHILDSHPKVKFTPQTASTIISSLLKSEDKDNQVKSEDKDNQELLGRFIQKYPDYDRNAISLSMIKEDRLAEALDIIAPSEGRISIALLDALNDSVRNNNQAHFDILLEKVPFSFYDLVSAAKQKPYTETSDFEIIFKLLDKISSSNEDQEIIRILRREVVETHSKNFYTDSTKIFRDQLLAKSTKLAEDFPILFLSVPTSNAAEILELFNKYKEHLSNETIAQKIAQIFNEFRVFGSTDDSKTTRRGVLMGAMYEHLLAKDATGHDLKPIINILCKDTYAMDAEQKIKRLEFIIDVFKLKQEDLQKDYNYIHRYSTLTIKDPDPRSEQLTQYYKQIDAFLLSKFPGLKDKG